MHAPRDTVSAPAQQSAAARDSHPRGAAACLQRRFGNRRAQRVVQAKLTVGRVDDPLEREADRVSGLAMGQSVRRAPRSVRRAPESVGHVHGAGGGVADTAVADAVARAGGGGQAVPDGVRERMEQVSGADFSGVRVHVDAEADRLNDALGSRAFTVGADVFVRRSEYRPGSSEGDALLGHELTHTIQQGAARQGPSAPTAAPVAQRKGGGLGRGGLGETEKEDTERYKREKARQEAGPFAGLQKHVLPKGTLVYHATSMPSARILERGPTRTGKQSKELFDQRRGKVEEENKRAVAVGEAPKTVEGGALGHGFYVTKERDNAPNHALGGGSGSGSWGVILEFTTQRDLEYVRAPDEWDFDTKFPGYLDKGDVRVIAGKVTDSELVFQDADKDLGRPTRFWLYEFTDHDMKKAVFNAGIPGLIHRGNIGFVGPFTTVAGLNRWYDNNAEVFINPALVALRVAMAAVRLRILWRRRARRTQAAPPADTAN